MHTNRRINMNELKKYSTPQLVDELRSRAETGVYNCDLYRDDNYRVTIKKIHGDNITINPPTFCDIIVVNRKDFRRDIFGK